MRRGFWAHPAFPGALVSEVQEVYKSQGVDINDKHIEHPRHHAAAPRH
jgi:hypothetical protein